MSGRGIRPARWYLVVMLGMLMTGTGGHALAQQDSVYTVQIEGEIERGLAAYVERVYAQARETGASTVVLLVNTPGGLLDAALDIKDTILSSPIRTIALVDRQAFSAGALISIAAHDIYMVPGASIGAATPIQSGTGETASEKVISAVRKSFAATAEARGRDPAIAEAMVDSSVQVAGLVESGKLLTMTAEEALEWGYSDGFANGLGELLDRAGLSASQVSETRPSLAENLVRFLTNAVVSSLLITLGTLGLLFEIVSPGWGVGGTVALASLGLFFFGHVIAGLAGWEGIVLVLAGLALMGVEVFVVPGFGVAGVLGILSFLGGLYMSMVGDFTSGEQLVRAGYILAGSLLAMLAGVWVLLNYLPRRRSLGGLFLVESVASVGKPQVPHGETESDSEPRRDLSLVGSRGKALTRLRPAGVAEIGGKRVDVVTEGDWVERGTAIEVIQDTGYRRVVRAVDES